MIAILGNTTEAEKIHSLIEGNGRKISSMADFSPKYGERYINSNFMELKKPPDTKRMMRLIREHSINLIIDASHPFAKKVSRNAINACKHTGVNYLRFERERISFPANKLIIKAEGFESAIEKSLHFGNTIFLNIGNNAVHFFNNAAKQSGKRVVAKLTPDPTIVKRCLRIGIYPEDIIVMKGALRKELFLYLLKEYSASVLVIRDIGEIVVKNEVESALDMNIPCIVIQRPELGIKNPVKDYAQLLDAIKEVI